MDFAIQDTNGNLSLPNGSTVSGTSTPAQSQTNGSTNGSTKPSNSASASIPLPVRSDPSTTSKSSHTGTFGVKSGLAQMLKGGVIMDVMNVDQAKVAEEAGAVAVMALERIPSLIRSQGGIARMVSIGVGDGISCRGGRADVIVFFYVFFLAWILKPTSLQIYSIATYLPRLGKSNPYHSHPSPHPPFPRHSPTQP